MGDPPTRPRPAQDAILAATERLLTQRSFSALAVNDIIAAAGVSRTSFYAHFASRSAVLAACLRRVVGELAVAVDPFLTAAERDPEAAIRLSLERWVTLATEHGPLLRTASEEWPHDPELRALWGEVMGAFSTGAARVITRAGAVRAQDAEALATCLMWGCERVLHVTLIGGAPGLDSPGAIVEPLTQMITGTAFPVAPAGAG